MGGSMVYDGVFPVVMGQRLDSAFASGGLPYESCEILMLTAPTWTSADNLAAYCAMGVHAQPHAIVLYVAVNDVYAMFRPDTVVAQPDYSHFRERWNQVPPMPWDMIPGWADSSRAIALTRYGLDRIFQARYQAAPPKRLGLLYDFNPDQVLDTTFASFHSNLEAITSIAESRGTMVFLVSELEPPDESGGDAMVAGVEMLNSIAGRVADRHSRSGLTHFVDAAGIIPSTDRTFSDWSHLTPEGNRLLGELIADSIHSALFAGGVW
jgi:lysophospholipase L1-like esterase